MKSFRKFYWEKLGKNEWKDLSFNIEVIYFITFAILFVIFLLRFFLQLIGLSGSSVFSLYTILILFITPWVIGVFLTLTGVLFSSFREYRIYKINERILEKEEFQFLKKEGFVKLEDVYLEGIWKLFYTRIHYRENSWIPRQMSKSENQKKEGVMFLLFTEVTAQSLELIPHYITEPHLNLKYRTIEQHAQKEIIVVTITLEDFKENLSEMWISNHLNELFKIAQDLKLQPLDRHIAEKVIV